MPDARDYLVDLPLRTPAQNPGLGPDLRLQWLDFSGLLKGARVGLLDFAGFDLTNASRPTLQVPNVSLNMALPCWP